jgi:hypothetical protein
MARVAPLIILALALLLGCGDDASPPTPPPPGTGPVTPPPAAVTEIAPPAPGDAIGAQMHTRAQQFAEGMEPGTQLFRGTLQTGENQDYQAVLQAGRCFKIIGVGAPTVTDLDLFLFDPNGVQVQQDTATDAYPVLGLSTPICPDQAGAYRVQVRMYAGSGEFGVQVWQTVLR